MNTLTTHYLEIFTNSYPFTKGLQNLLPNSNNCMHLKVFFDKLRWTFLHWIDLGWHITITIDSNYNNKGC